MKTLKEYAAIVNARLKTIIAEQERNAYNEGDMPELLARSMRYSLLAGGKRLRPSMMLAAIDMLGGDYEKWIDFACAIEMIHSYSLIHDDLPGMDDDTMRRGRPTNHVVFGVGQAILAGDGLLNLAFETMLHTVLAQPDCAVNGLHAIAEVATGAGVSGMIGGQVMDLYCEHNGVANEKALSYIQRNKTACMFIYPLHAAGWLAGADKAAIDSLGRYGEAFGRLFQATDDMLDVTGDEAKMGKTLGKDAEQGKLTMISFYGIDGTGQRIDSLRREAIDAISRFGDNGEIFKNLISDIASRNS